MPTSGRTAGTAGKLSNDMKTATKKPKSQCQRLLAYLRKNRKGVTTMEAMTELGICRLSERIRELECTETGISDYHYPTFHIITRTREKTSGGATVTRYKLAR